VDELLALFQVSETRCACLNQEGLVENVWALQGDHGYHALAFVEVTMVSTLKSLLVHDDHGYHALAFVDMTMVSTLKSLLTHDVQWHR